MDITLAVIGFVFLGAAVIGGGLKAVGIEVPALSKSRQQTLLSIIGALALVASVAAPRLNAQASSPRTIASTSTPAPVPSSGTLSSQTAPAQPSTSQSLQPTPLANLPTHPTCFDTVFNSIPTQRVVVVQGTSSGTWGQIGQAYRDSLGKISGQYGLLLVDQGTQSAIRLNIDATNQQFSIAKAVDDNCNDLQATPISGSLGTSVNFQMNSVDDAINLRTETGSGRYWLEIWF